MGLGNIWRFPYLTGKDGGAAFLVIYLVCVFALGIPGMIGEFIIGRHGGSNAARAYYKMSGGKPWWIVGAVGALTSTIILGFYAVVAGWCLQYLYASVAGQLIGDAHYVETYFQEFSTDPVKPVLCTLGFILLTHAVVVNGVRNGIEKVSNLLMPTLFVLLIIIAVASCMLPGASEGISFLFKPDFSKVDKDVMLDALGQAFFSLSITGSGMIIYGSYLPKNEDVVHSSCMTAVLDTCAAMLAGFAILPSVFAFGLDPASGPKLLFITLPRVFQQMPFGRLFAFFFFISVLFAGITSLANMLEAVSEAAQTRLKLSRKAAVLLACGAALAVGLFIERDALMGTLMDVITIYVVPIGAILGAVMAYWVLGIDKMEQELMNGRSKPLSRAFAPLAKYVYIFLAALVVFFSFIIPGGIG